MATIHRLPRNPIVKDAACIYVQFNIQSPISGCGIGTSVSQFSPFRHAEIRCVAHKLDVPATLSLKIIIAPQPCSFDFDIISALSGRILFADFPYLPMNRFFGQIFLFQRIRRAVPAICVRSDRERDLRMIGVTHGFPGTGQGAEHRLLAS